MRVYRKFGCKVTIFFANCKIFRIFVPKFACAHIQIRRMRLVFASNNAHKLEEVRQIMPSGISVCGLSEIGFSAEIAETGQTLEANSLLKAEAVWEWLTYESSHGRVPQGGKIDGVFADDTGLEIDALDGAPGVYTARWYKLGADGKVSDGCSELSEKEVFAANRAKALRELKDKDNRGAQFRTVVTLLTCSPDGKGTVRQEQVSGIVRGRIAQSERGEGGFGYDPLFMPEGYDCTFAEMSHEAKNSISHRGRALAELVRILKK